MIVQWNTGAAYTVHGQRIVAELLPDGAIRFVDVDRGIAGKIAPTTDGLSVPANAADIRQDVMQAYLHNRYAPDWDGGWARNHLTI